MRKFYSIVLMATALLIGTNAWANSVFDGLASEQGTNTIKVTIGGVTKYAENLQTAVNAVAAGETATIQLLATQTLSDPVIIPQVVTAATDDEKVVNRELQHITLDLNGKDIQPSTSYIGAAIMLFKGELNITGAGSIKRDGASKGSWVNFSAAAIVVCGADGDKDNSSNDRSKQEWSTLTIGKDVQVIGDGKWNSNKSGGYGIAIQDFHNESTASHNNGTYFQGLDKYIHYANLGYSTFKKGVDNPMWWTGTESGSAFGVKIIIKGTVYGYQRGINIVGHINQSPDIMGETSDKRPAGSYPFYQHYFPYVKIESGAKVYCNDDPASGLESGNGGVYGGGWCILDISGEVYGQTGVYVKAGDVNIKDGTVYSTSTNNYSNANYGGNVSGNAIFIASDKSYAGETDVVIEGDSKITGNGGAAIAEKLANNATNTSVENITITGGTIEGGDAGAIAVSAGGADKTTVYGGGLEGTITKDGETLATTDITASDTHVTEVVVDGKTVFVVSQGDGPADEAKKTAWNDVAALSNKTNPVDAAWTAVGTGTIGDGTTATTIYLGELQMISGTGADAKQVLTIKNKSTLEVKHLMMNNFAQIIVEAGAKLIVNGTQGIVAPVVDNIVLQASETDQAVFLFNPAVKSNRHPNATVQMYAKAHHDADGTWHSQHFGIPTYGTPAITWPAGTTYLYRSEESGWVNITSLDQLEPFVGYALNNSSETAAGVYTFKGELNGNTDAPISFVKTNYNLVANSYAAPMSMKALFDDLQSQYGNAVELSAWIYESAYDRHTSITKTGVEKAAEEDPTAVTTIAPMQGFILYCGATKPANGTIGYTEAIWNNPNKTGVAIKAPARSAEDNSVRATIVVSTEKSQDQVVLRESDEYSSAFDNGADAHKYMSERVFDLYSENGEENYSDVATDNLEGTTLTLKAKAETAYTMSFRNVNNFNYVVRDNLSGAIIPVEEGTTYEFYMAEGTTANGRFEVVGRQNMPTAIENTEAVKSAKGVYTILGQYLGESNILNTLPSGIYVVDGQRIVK